MTPTELMEMVSFLRENQTETQTIEVKAAQKECPKRLFDTLSSFSNQDEGGVIVFGIDESESFTLVGVYDAHDLQKRITEQCEQMSPCVRPVFTVVAIDEKLIVSAEIPSMDLADRPCFYAGVGRVKGSYVRVGDADRHMSEYEIYAFEAYKKRYRDDIRPIAQASTQALDAVMVEQYLQEVKKRGPNCAALNDRQLGELMSLTRDGVPSLAAILLFGLYPQAYFPQLVVTATVSAGQNVADNLPEEPRFLDNRRIEGTIPVMFSEAMAFVRRNMKVQTVIEPETGRRNDRDEYPVIAVREAILNALIHRDYSKYTEGRPITVNFFSDRLEITSPGGIYGRVGIGNLGKTTPDTRNPSLVTAMETLRLAENRYSGIPTIRNAMRRANLPEPEFDDRGDSFVVILRNGLVAPRGAKQCAPEEIPLLKFCEQPRSRQEIADFLHISSISYAIRTHVMPLVRNGHILMSHPDNPRSPRQRYSTNSRKPA